MESLGKIVLLPRGVYDSQTTYNRLDIVTHEGSAYACMKDNVIGIEPTDGDTWTVVIEGAPYPMSETKYVDEGGDGVVLKARAVGNAVTDVLEGLTDEEGKLLYKGSPIVSDSEDLFTGSTAEYETAEAEGKLKDGTLVALDDDETDPSYVNPDDFDLTNGVLALSDKVKNDIKNVQNGVTTLDTIVGNINTKLDDIVADGYYKTKNIVSIFENGIRNANNGYYEYHSARVCSKYLIKVDASKNYVISSTTSNAQSIVVFLNSNKQVVGATSSTSPAWKPLPLNFETPNDCAYIYVNLNLSSNTDVSPSTFENVMLEEGTTPTEFVGTSISNVEATQEITTLTSKLQPIYDEGFYSGNLLNIDEVLNVSVYKEVAVSLPSGKYKISIEGVTSTDTNTPTICSLRLYYNGGFWNYVFNRRMGYQELDVDATSPIIKMEIYCADGYGNSQGDTAVWTKLMIRKASIGDNTYTPYAKSNVQLTNEIGTLSTKVSGIKQVVSLDGLRGNPSVTISNSTKSTNAILFAYRSTADGDAFLTTAMVSTAWNSGDITDPNNKIGGSLTTDSLIVNRVRGVAMTGIAIFF